MTMVETQEQVEKIANETCEDWGFEKAEVTISAYRDFKVRWTRTPTWIKFSISDYLIGLPEEAVRGFFNGLFSKIRGCDETEDYQNFIEHVFSQAYLEKNRPTYIRRCKIKDAPYQEFDDVQVYFNSFNNDKAVGYSAFFRTIFLNDKLKDAPKDILETLIADTYNTIQDAKNQLTMEWGIGSASLSQEDIEKAENYLSDIGLEWC